MEFLQNIRALILDMDGVIWRDSEPIGDLGAIFQAFNSRGLKLSLATNNATYTVKQYLEKLKTHGVRLDASQIINSPQVAAQHLAGLHPGGGPVYVIGEAGLAEALESSGFHHRDSNVLAVVVGMDRYLTYEKLCQATLHLRSGALFIATNGDRTFPVPAGLVPGVGATLAALETASEVSPRIVGKPEPAMYQIALERMGCTPQETLVIGDRMETDILGGQKMGCRTALVLSGVTTEEDARAYHPAPDLIIKDLSTLVQMIEQAPCR